MAAIGVGVGAIVGTAVGAAVATGVTSCVGVAAAVGVATTPPPTASGVRRGSAAGSLTRVAATIATATSASAVRPQMTRWLGMTGLPTHPAYQRGRIDG